MICVHDIIAITGLAVRVSIAYKDAQVDYRNISEKVAALKLLIDKAAPHFKSMSISLEEYHHGEQVLKDCQSVLEDLDYFIEKYKRLASINKRLVLNRVKLGKKDITALEVQLVSNTMLLNGFVRSCEYAVVQAQLAILLGLDSTSTRIPINSIAAFAANADPEIAYDQFCNDLCQIGITEDIIWQKKDGILEILRSQGMVAKSPIGGSGTSDKDQVLEAAYHEYCNDLYRMGFTEDLMPPKARVLKILRSRGIVSSSQSGGIIGKKDGNPSSTKIIPSFRPSPQFWLNSDGDSSALLHVAANNCHLGTVELLFGRGALLDKDNNSFLHCAARGGYTDTVKLLLGKGAPIEALDKDKSTPLHLATYNGHTDTVELLLNKGAPIEALNNDQSTALHLAVLKGHTGAVELLLQKGASIGAKRGDDNIPLHLAAREGHTGAVELLLQKGASIEAKRKDHSTPLHLAAYYGHTGTVELLLQKGASVEARRTDGDTPLHLAAGLGHTVVVQLLLQKGASVESIKDKYGSTPLHLAAHHGHTGAVELLLQNGASIGAKRKDHSTPLHLAAYYGHTGTVELLLGRGALINALDLDYDTPLHNAAWEGYTGVVELLLEKGASLEVKNKNGETPLHLAEQYGRTDTVQLLRNKAAEALRNKAAEALRNKAEEPAVRDTRRRSPFLASLFRR